MELPGLRPPTSVGRASDASRQTETAYPDGICAPKAAGVASALQKAKCAASCHAEAQGAAGRWPAFPPLLQEQAGLASLVGGCRAFGSRRNHDAGWRSRCLCSGRDNRKNPDTVHSGGTFCCCIYALVVFYTRRKTGKKQCVVFHCIFNLALYAWRYLRSETSALMSAPSKEIYTHAIEKTIT